MSNWFECKVKFQKTIADNDSKLVTESYLIDAVSFTEAESRMHTELEPYISGDFHVTNIKIAKFMDLLPSETGTKWYKCKVAFIRIDEEKGVERRSNVYMMVQANDLKEAYDLLEKDLGTTMNDFEITGIQESLILDVFPYFNAGQENKDSQAIKSEPAGIVTYDADLDEEEEDETLDEEEEDEIENDEITESDNNDNSEEVKD